MTSSVRTFLLVAAAITGVMLAPSRAFAQTPTDEVLAVVRTMFDAMRQADTLKLKGVFTEGARFALIGGGRAGAPPAISYMPVDGWIAGVGRSGGTWDERIYDTEVRVDDNIASVWTSYSFYVSGRLRHCGVDSLELLKGPNGWKVTQLSDTQKMTGCREVPPGGEVPPSRE